MNPRVFVYILWPVRRVLISLILYLVRFPSRVSKSHLILVSSAFAGADRRQIVRTVVAVPVHK